MPELITRQCGSSEGADRAFDIVAIAASFGGIAAMGTVLAGLPAAFPLPVLICQHIEPNRPSLLPEILARRTALRVVAAAHGDMPAAGSVYVAPSDRHLLIRADHTLGLSAGELVNFARPAADVLFRSIADVHGARAIVVVLTGRGRDGARGVEVIQTRGGFTIARDEASAEAFDMPCAAVDIGRADLVLPLDRIAFALEVLANRDFEYAIGGETQRAP